MRAHALGALVLVFACALPAAAQEPCEFLAFESGSGVQHAWTKDDPLCVRLRAYGPVFERLREAASFSPGEIKLQDRPIDVSDEPTNAYYSGKSRAVLVNWSFLQETPADSPSLIFALAHDRPRRAAAGRGSR